jgi:hypothetical protein
MTLLAEKGGAVRISSLRSGLAAFVMIASPVLVSQAVADDAITCADAPGLV